jgi:hypothetical protein
MATNYPGALDNSSTLPNPAAGNPTNSPSHAGQHANANDSIKAIEAKVGTGASTPVVNTIFKGTGTGTSAWGNLSSAELLSIMTDETGSGALVFANTPTLITPKTDIINEATATNGVTIDGLNIKDSQLNTNNSVVAANITDASITATKLATSAITLGYAQIIANVTTTSTSFVDATGLSVVAVVPTGGRRVEFNIDGSAINVSGAGSVWNVALLEDGTVIQQWYRNSDTSAYNIPLSLHFSKIPAAGSHTYKVQFATSAGTVSIVAGTTSATPFTVGPASLTVKAA